MIDVANVQRCIEIEHAHLRAERRLTHSHINFLNEGDTKARALLGDDINYKDGNLDAAVLEELERCESRPYRAFLTHSGEFIAWYTEKLELEMAKNQVEYNVHRFSARAVARQNWPFPTYFVAPQQEQEMLAFLEYKKAAYKRIADIEESMK